jgi:hypothetical protein
MPLSTDLELLSKKIGLSLLLLAIPLALITAALRLISNF